MQCTVSSVGVGVLYCIVLYLVMYVCVRVQNTNTRMNQELSFLSQPKVSAEATDDHVTLQVGHEWKSVRFCTGPTLFMSDLL